MYSETRKMTPISGGFANKAQNFEAVAQYQFDFGLRPSVAYLLFSAAMGVKVCTVTAWLLYPPVPHKLNEMRHRQKLARMVRKPVV